MLQRSQSWSSGKLWPWPASSVLLSETAASGWPDTHWVQSSGGLEKHLSAKDLPGPFRSRADTSQKNLDLSVPKAIAAASGEFLRRPSREACHVR